MTVEALRELCAQKEDEIAELAARCDRIDGELIRLRGHVEWLSTEVLGAQR